MAEKLAEERNSLQQQLEEAHRARRQAEALYRRSQRLLHHLHQAAPVVTYLFNLEKGIFTYVNDRLFPVLGYQVNDLNPNGSLLLPQLIHPDDLLPANMHRQQLNLAPGKPQQSVEIRLRHRNGQWRWMLITETVFSRNLNGGTRTLLGSVIDLSAIKKSDEALRRREEEYRQLLAQCQGLVFSHDMSGRILWANHQLPALLGYQPEEVTGRNIAEFTPGSNTRLMQAYLRRILLQGKAQGLAVLLDQSGSRKYLSFHNLIQEAPGSSPYMIGLALDITAQVQKEKALRRARFKAERNSRARSLFLAGLSHEIRTPMNGVLGLLALLHKTSLDAGQRNYLNLINHSTRSLLAVINDLLDLAKIESGNLELESIPFHFHDTLRAAFQSFIFQAEEKEIQLSLDLPELAQPFLVGDPYRLNQVLMNLLGNAIKFTQRGKVMLGVKVQQEGFNAYAFEISVTDTGPGIAPDKLEAIFEGYNQAGSTRSYGGIGLGLAISRNLVQLQGGRLWAESAPGIGSRFAFTLTYAKAHPSGIREMAGAAAEPTTLGDLQVLLVEDNPINQVLAKTLLERWGAHVDVATTGLEALALHEKHPYDLILMDIQMPEMDGVEATRQIRRMADPAKARIPIIALTANALKGDSDRYLAAGMDDYLAKPYEEEKLFLKIAGVLDRTRPAHRAPAAPGGTAGKNPPLYRLSHLQALSRGNAAFLPKMLRLFSRDVPRQLKALRLHLAAGDWEKVGETAHNLKAAIDVLQIHTIREDIRGIELHARSRTNLQLVPAAAERVVATLKIVLEQIEEALPESLPS